MTQLRAWNLHAQCYVFQLNELDYSSFPWKILGLPTGEEAINWVPLKAVYTILYGTYSINTARLVNIRIAKMKCCVQGSSTPETYVYVLHIAKELNKATLIIKSRFHIETSNIKENTICCNNLYKKKQISNYTYHQSDT